MAEDIWKFGPGTLTEEELSKPAYDETRHLFVKNKDGQFEFKEDKNGN